jgi:hypothetical protein
MGSLFSEAQGRRVSRIGRRQITRFLERRRQVAYFGERDRRFRRNVTADFGDVTGAGRSVLRVFEL